MLKQNKKRQCNTECMRWNIKTITWHSNITS